MKGPLKEFIDFNPAERIAFGAMTRKIAMEHLSPNTRRVAGFTYERFKGGSKFKKNDVLMARITPCLENGKIAQATILEENEVAFGSTEFIVWRNKQGITDSKYLYYLATSPEIKEVAIKSMVGSSGRQRVQQSVIDNHVVKIPSLDKQRSIAATLSCLDDKIELNNRIIANLEAQAQAIFKSWFVDFEPRRGETPTGWSISTLDSLCSLISRGITPKYSDDSTQIVINQKCIRNNKIDLRESRSHMPVTKNEKWLQYGDIVINSTGQGTLGRVAQVFFSADNITADSHVTIVRPSKQNLKSYLGQWIISKEAKIESMASGSTGQTELSRERVKAMTLLEPDDSTLDAFANIIDPITEMIQKKQEENASLALTRDTLLPKLMSGEIEVPVEG